MHAIFRKQGSDNPDFVVFLGALQKIIYRLERIVLNRYHSKCFLNFIHFLFGNVLPQVNVVAAFKQSA